MLELICFIVGDNDEVFFINKVSFFVLFNIKDVIREGNRILGLFLFLIMQLFVVFIKFFMYVYVYVYYNKNFLLWIDFSKSIIDVILFDLYNRYI